MKNHEGKFSQFKRGVLGDFSPLINRAYRLAEYAHRGQNRKSGDPYLTHPVAIMNYLRSMGVEEEVLIIALLHDVVEDTPVLLKDIEDLFSPSVATAIYFLSKGTKSYFVNRESRDISYLKKLEAGFCYSYKVYLVKLVDRLHNLSTLHNISPDKRHSKLRETVMVYLPLFKNYLHLVPEAHQAQCEKIIADMDEILNDYLKEV